MDMDLSTESIDQPMILPAASETSHHNTNTTTMSTSSRSFSRISPLWVHVIFEMVVLGSIFAFFYTRTRSLQSEINETKQRLSELEKKSSISSSSSPSLSESDSQKINDLESHTKKHVEMLYSAVSRLSESVNDLNHRMMSWVAASSRSSGPRHHQPFPKTVRFGPSINISVPNNNSSSLETIPEEPENQEQDKETKKLHPSTPPSSSHIDIQQQEDDDKKLEEELKEDIQSLQEKKPEILISSSSSSSVSSSTTTTPMMIEKKEEEEKKIESCEGGVCKIDLSKFLPLTSSSSSSSLS